MAKIKRSLFKSFLNTNTVLSPTWSLISAGVPSGTVNMNPNILTETYIGDDNATITVESYAPTFPIEATAVNGDAVWEWVEANRVARAVLSDVETEMVNVWLYETPALGIYYAEKVNVSVQVDSFGGDAGTAAKLGYTINHISDPVAGGFDPTGLVFYPLAINTKLTTLAIGAVTLTPLFATDKSWLWYAGSVANGTDTVTMDSTLAGATIVQYDDGGTPVAQSDPASLDVGVNDLTVDVTVGTENVIYHISITRAAA